jgi:hypothetical protein
LLLPRPDPQPEAELGTEAESEPELHAMDLPKAKPVGQNPEAMAQTLIDPARETMPLHRGGSMG